MSRGTSHRTVRIEDGLWEAARTTADRRGHNLSTVLREALERYVKECTCKWQDAGSYRDPEYRALITKDPDCPEHGLGELDLQMVRQA